MVQFWSTADDQIVVVVVVVAVVGAHSAAVDSGVACVGSCCGVSGDVAAAEAGDGDGGGCGGGEGGEGPRPPHSTSSTIKTFLKIFFSFTDFCCPICHSEKGSDFS